MSRWSCYVTQVSVGIGQQQIVAVADPDRWHLILRPSVSNVYFSPRRMSNLSVPEGIQASPSSGYLQIEREYWGAVVGHDWYAYSPTGTVIVTVIEIIKR